MSAKRQCAPNAADESMSMDSRELYAAVGLSKVGPPIEERGKAATQQLKKKLFLPDMRLGREQTSSPVIVTVMMTRLLKGWSLLLVSSHWC